MSGGTGNTWYFVIVGHRDNPVYELDLSRYSQDGKQEDKRHMNQTVAHAALDLVDEAKWKTTNPLLKVVFRFNELNVAAFVTASQMRFLLVYDTLKTSDEGVKNLFMEMYDLYTKAALNPFYDPNTKLVSKSFGMKAMQIGKRYL